MPLPASPHAPAASPHAAPHPEGELAFARSQLLEQADAIRRAADRLGPALAHAADLIHRATDAGGTVLVSGLGKSGHVGAKIAATLSSLGITAHAVHPTEAAHGDLGRFRTHDVAICLSHSGETAEVVALAAVLKQDGLPIIAITRANAAKPTSLQRLADAVLDDAVDEEAAHTATGARLLAPTSSTTVAMALGDALALTLARRKNITDADFARRHPGGQLGGLLRPVTDLLRFRAGDNLPLIATTETVADALRHADTLARRPGAILVIDQATGRLAGLFTDGDLRRLILRNPADLARPIADVMTANPRTLPDSALARDAAALVREFRADEIPVVDAQGRPVGLLDVQDLVAMRLVAG